MQDCGYELPRTSLPGTSVNKRKKKDGTIRPLPAKHLLHKPQYQIDEHYDDNHSYSDNDEVSSRHLPPPPLAPSASLRLA
jgi:hypothetical protein